MKIETFDQAWEYLLGNLPMFQRIGPVAYKMDLGNTLALCEALGNPHRKFKSIHIAGTNGKGSTSHILASIFQSSGYTTGLYTSPHLKSFTERIKVNGKEVEEGFVIGFVNRTHEVLQQVKPSFFEMTVAMAFEWFALNKVDMAIVEVGLGGRFDSTNIIHPELSIITNIGWDHTELLGDTLEKIAFEKAGIIKPSVPVVISERKTETEMVFINKAKETSSPIFFAEDHFTIDPLGDRPGHFNILEKKTGKTWDIVLPLGGLYQAKNLSGILMGVEVMRQQGYALNPAHVREGMEKTVLQTGLKGRWQVLGEKPKVICDTGHNIDGIRMVVKQIQTIPYKTLHWVFGVVKDKDISNILEILPRDAHYYFCQANIPRALEAQALKEKAKEHGLEGEAIPDVNKALEKAKENAHPDDLIFIGGSTFVVAEIEGL